MSERDELADLIASVTIDTKSGDVLRVHPDGETPVFEGDQRTADALLAAGYRKPRTITTAEEIRDLPALTMVVHDDMANGGPLEAYVVPDDGTVMFKDRYPFHLLCMNGDYVDSEAMPLPLTVVYEVAA